MATIELHLYRVKFIKPAQTKLFYQNFSPRDIFEKALEEKPSVGLRRNHAWHLGNVDYFDADGGRFAVGRTTKTTVEKFDIDTGDFIEELDDSGPYTYVYFDAQYGLLAIAKKAKVAPSVRSIARKIQALFSKSEIVQNGGVEVRVDIIPDPDGFLKKIRTAYAIKRFTAEFTGPNPIDADELFQKPMSFYCQTLEATNGVVAVRGEHLNEEAVASVAKSTAATGNNASALIQPSKGSRLLSISFEGNATKILVDSEAHMSDVLQKVRENYFSVRK
jgi:hypothetical protein